MNLVKFLTSFLVAIFGLFLSSPIFAIENRGSAVVIMYANAGDICSTNITCEKTPEGIYACSDTPETISAQGVSVHQIPGSQGASHHGLIYLSYIQDDVYYPTRGTITEAQEENYVYPFVRITKIQV